MKKISNFCFFVFLILVTGKANAQLPNSNANEIYRVLDIQMLSTRTEIVTCRSESGNTIQFQLLQNQPKLVTDNKGGAITVGTEVVADFKTGTASLKNNTIVKYQLIKSNFSERCCNITAIDRSFDYQKCYISAKIDTSNGRTYFTIYTTLFDTYPPFNLHLGDPIYQKNYSGKRYAIFKNPVAVGGAYVTLSYEFNFITNDLYNSIQKANVPNPADTVSSGSSNTDSTGQVQTQKLNTNQASPTSKVEQNKGESLTSEGYETVIAKFIIVGGEKVDVKINGLKMLSYGNGDHEVNLSHFLKKGKMNTIGFSFTKGSYSRIEIIGKFAGDEQGISIYSFHPHEKELEGSFEVPFAGVKK